MSTWRAPKLINRSTSACWSSGTVAGTKLLEAYTVPPLLPNQVLAIGVTSYNGMLYLGVKRRPGSDERSRRAAEPAARIAR